MDSEKRKKTMLFIGSLIVAAMFLSSYLAFGSNSTHQTTTSTTVFSSSTTFVSGNVNATVLNYSDHFTIGVRDANATKLSQLNSSLSSMESNGSIESYYLLNNSLSIYSGSSDIFDLYNSISSLLGSTPPINTTALIALPSGIYLNYGAYQYFVISNNLSYAVPVEKLVPIGSKLLVKVNALVYKKNSSSSEYLMYGQPTVTLS